MPGIVGSVIKKAIHKLEDKLEELVLDSHVPPAIPPRIQQQQHKPSLPSRPTTSNSSTADWSRPELLRLPGGDKLVDFSMVGCPEHILAQSRASDIFTATLTPSSNAQTDRSEEIKEAISSISARQPNSQGFRGRIFFQAGTYTIDCTGFDITQSGIIIAGVGSETKLICTNKKPETLFRITGPDSKMTNKPANRLEIVDDRISVGGTRLKVAALKGIKVGDTVKVVRLSNQDWIHSIGMDKIPPRPDGKECGNWDPFWVVWDRTVVRISENTIEIDIGITSPIEKKFGGGYVYKFETGHFVKNVVVRELRIEAVTTGIMQCDKGTGIQCQICENHIERACLFTNAMDCLVYRVETVKLNFHSWIKGNSRNITILDCKYLEPAGTIDGSKRYGFFISGQRSLVEACYCEKARHAYATDVRVPGPNVFYKCTSEKNLLSSETHHKWASGILFDSIKGPVAVQNRLWMGKGQGWSGAYCLAWNCEGPVIFQHPPNAWNYAVGYSKRMTAGKAHFPKYAPDLNQSFVWMDCFKNIPKSLYEYQKNQKQI